MITHNPVYVVDYRSKKLFKRGKSHTEAPYNTAKPLGHSIDETLLFRVCLDQ